MITPDKPPTKASGGFGYLLSLFLIAGFILAADRFTKFMVVSSLAPGQSWTPIVGLERLFQFTYITNTGAAFGLFPDSGGFFVAVAIVVAVAIIYYYRLVTNWLLRISLGLQFGGAIGNLWDRIFNGGEVVDYVDIGFWPIFNIADISIITGVTILAIWLWQAEEEAQNT